MPLAIVTTALMGFGLVAWQRALWLSTQTAAGSIAHFEAQRAADFACLLSILTMPWLLIAAIWIR